MKSAKMIFEKLLRPPLPLLILIPLLSFAALIFIFVSGSTDGASAYGIYCMSAYSLTVWVIALPKLVRRMHTAFDNSKAVQRLIRTEIVTKYLNDPEFRGSVGIFRRTAGISAHLFTETHSGNGTPLLPPNGTDAVFT